MKLTIVLSFVAVLMLAGCGKEPEKTAEGVKGAVKTVTGADTAPVAVDGTWKTRCLNATYQTANKPYIAEAVFKNGKFYQKWTSFKDQDCLTVEGEAEYTVAFAYRVGADLAGGLKAFNYSWNHSEGAPVKQYQGQEFNVISVNENTLNFYPLYIAPTDQFDGSNAGKRFRSALNTKLGYVETYARVK